MAKSNSATTVLIGCRLPNGLILHHPEKPDVKVTLAGVNSSKIIGATYVTTEVDEEFWQVWKLRHEGVFEPLTSNAIFEAKDEASAKDFAKDLTKEKTGFEPLSKDAAGVKPAEK